MYFFSMFLLAGFIHLHMHYFPNKFIISDQCCQLGTIMKKYIQNLGVLENPISAF